MKDWSRGVMILCIIILTPIQLFFIFRFVKGISTPIETLTRFTSEYREKKTFADRENVRKKIQKDPLFEKIKKKNDDEKDLVTGLDNLYKKKGKNSSYESS